MPAFENIGEKLRKHSGKILSGIGAALVTPLVARIASRWTGRAVDTMWGVSEDQKSEGSTPAEQTDQTPAAAQERPGEQSEAGQENYEEWTKKELYSLAQDLDIHGRSTMQKAELIEAIRTHQAEES